jgi:hypothetical protein
VRAPVYVTRRAGRSTRSRRAPPRSQASRATAELREHVGDDEWFRARFHAPFVFVPPLAQRRVVAAEAWLARPVVADETAVAHLLRRYLAAFGPATARDAARWSGLPAPVVRAGLERVRTIDLGDGLLDLPRAPRPGDVPAPPRLCRSSRASCSATTTAAAS